MFKSISLIEENRTTNTVEVIYLLQDTKFNYKLSSGLMDVHVYDTRGEACVIPAGLICVYEDLSQNVAKNIALFYRSTIGHLPRSRQLDFLEIDRNWTELHYAPLEYANKYYNCVLNQLAMLTYTNRNHRAQSVVAAVLPQD